MCLGLVRICMWWGLLLLFLFLYRRLYFWFFLFQCICIDVALRDGHEELLMQGQYFFFVLFDVAGPVFRPGACVKFFQWCLSFLLSRLVVVANILTRVAVDHPGGFNLAVEVGCESSMPHQAA